MASLLDLWYVSQTTKRVGSAELQRLRARLDASPAWSLLPVTEQVVDVTMSIPRDVLADPWDRLIVATAQLLALPLVSRDGAIAASGLVSVVW